MIKKSILIVDDENDIRYVLKKFFSEHNYTVIEAENGEACLEKINQEQPNLILLDILMPGIDGWEVCRKIKEDESLAHIPVSMLSVLSDSEDVRKSLKYALADTHLSKPIDFSLLEETVEKLISEYLANPPKPPTPPRSLTPEEEKEYFKQYSFNDST